MSEQNGTTTTTGIENVNPASSSIESKGKGKAIDTPHDMSMDEEDDSSDEETGAEEEVSIRLE